MMACIHAHCQCIADHIWVTYSGGKEVFVRILYAKTAYFHKPRCKRLRNTTIYKLIYYYYRQISNLPPISFEIAKLLPTTFEISKIPLSCR
jgi:hypothetical protein